MKNKYVYLCLYDIVRAAPITEFLRSIISVFRSFLTDGLCQIEVLPYVASCFFQLATNLYHINANRETIPFHFRQETEFLSDWKDKK